MEREKFFVDIKNTKIEIERLSNGKFKMPPIAKQLQNKFSGFQPKPAVEVVIVAMKPLECKTYLDQALKNGHGCTWLDECGIPLYTNEQKQSATSNIEFTDHNTYQKGTGRKYTSKGRFPANVLCEDDVLNEGIKRKSGAILTHHKRSGNSNLGKTFKIRDRTGEFADWKSNSGEYSRYFSLDAWFAERIKTLPKEAQKTFPWLIVPKASKSEKNRGLEGTKEKEIERIQQLPEGFISSYGNVRNKPAPQHNFHPTCKPIKLMSWLITLASREGDIVLDPFCGSGTTLIAAKMLSRQYIGIEREADYCEIARKRVSAIPTKLDQY